LIRGDLHLILIEIIRRNNNFEVASQVGRCLCSLMLKGSLEGVAYMGPALFPEVMASMLTSPDMHLLLLSLSSMWHLVEANASFDFHFLREAFLQDSFYDALVSIAVGAVDDQIRTTATCIVAFADSIREEED
jgi:hypothetical protein